jgi:hypothetical protein
LAHYEKSWISYSVWRVLHFFTLIASAMVPKTLDWKGELAKLMPFLRTLFWVCGAFIGYSVRGHGHLLGNAAGGGVIRL